MVSTKMVVESKKIRKFQKRDGNSAVIIATIRGQSRKTDKKRFSFNRNIGKKDIEYTLIS